MNAIEGDNRMRVMGATLTKSVRKMVKSLNIKAYDTVAVKATYKAVVMKHENKNDASQLVPCIIIKVKRGEPGKGG